MHMEIIYGQHTKAFFHVNPHISRIFLSVLNNVKLKYKFFMCEFSERGFNETFGLFFNTRDTENDTEMGKVKLLCKIFMEEITIYSKNR